MNKISPLTLLGRLYKTLSYKRKTQIFGLFLLMVIGTIAELVSLGLVIPFLSILTTGEQIVDHPAIEPIVIFLKIEQTNQLLLLLTILFSLAATFSGIIRFVLLWTQTRIGQAIGSDLGILAYQQILHQPYATHVERNTSEVISLLINKVNTIVHYVVIPTLLLITSTLIALAICIFLVTVDPGVAVVIYASLGIIYLGVVYTTRKKLLNDGTNVAQYQNDISKVVQEGLGGIRDIIIDRLQEFYVTLFRKADLRLRRALSNVTIISGSPRMLIETLGLLLIAWIAYDMADQNGGLENAIPTLGAFALAAQRTLPVVQQAYSSWTSILAGLPSLRDLLDNLNILPSHNTRLANPLDFHRKLELRDIEFRYHRTTSLILDNVNLTIHPGDRVGIIGTTGSGKSSLVDIIMALLRPVNGKLLVDGIEINEHNCHEWQAHIAHVPQSIYLIDASIAENIAFGITSENIDHARVQFAAESAQLTNTIKSWPNGYQTRVGERGLQLSGGQRQRIAIARALYKRANVLIFDEATSALDTDTENALMSAINSLNKDITIIMVAHRLTTLRHCTQIIRLADGRIAETGDYFTLCGNITA